MMIRHAVDCRRGNLNDTLDAMLLSRLEHVTRAIDVGRENVFTAVKRQRRRAVNDDIHTLHGAVHRRPVANVAFDGRDLSMTALRIIELGDIERRHPMPARQQVAHEIDAKKTGPAGNQIRFAIGHSRLLQETSVAPASCMRPAGGRVLYLAMPRRKTPPAVTFGLDLSFSVHVNRRAHSYPAKLTR